MYLKYHQIVEISNWSLKPLEFDLISQGEPHLMEFEDCLLVCWTTPYYHLLTYDQMLSGMGHNSFEYNYN